jgi:hypothetical protein
MPSIARCIWSFMLSSMAFGALLGVGAVVGLGLGAEGPALATAVAATATEPVTAAIPAAIAMAVRRLIELGISSSFSTVV